MDYSRDMRSLRSRTDVTSETTEDRGGNERSGKAWR